MVRPLKLSVGPAPSHWGERALAGFYRRLADTPVDHVYLGETACPKRSCFSRDLVAGICEGLTLAGKEVYASSSVLVKDKRQHRDFDQLAQQVGRVEINSPAFLAMSRRYPAVGGMFLNVYNSAAASILAQNLLGRIVLPCELGSESIRAIARRSPVATEVIVHGHIPIAMSCGCPTARAFGRDSKGCELACQDYPDGMILEAGDRPIFRIDGPRTLSCATFCLVEYLSQLEEAGVDTVRILPQWEHTDRVACIYRDVLDHRRQPRDALEELKTLSATSLCNGWFLGKAGWVYESTN